MYKKILLTGITGQVGHALHKALLSQASTVECVALDRNQLDMTQPEQIRNVVQSIQPDLIINPAAYTAVDKAESEADLAYAINAIAPKILAEEASKLNARLIHFSTDYVYNGQKIGAYYEVDATQPLSAYGKSKLAGEEAIQSVGLRHLIFRTSWVYGAYGKNFMKTILRLANEREALDIVADQVGAPTSSHAMAEVLVKILMQDQSDTSGIYHLVNSGKTSWYEFAQTIVDEANRLHLQKGKLPLLVKEINPITTDQYPTAAVRPANSELDTTKLFEDFGIRMPHWHQSLKDELNRLEMSSS